MNQPLLNKTAEGGDVPAIPTVDDLLGRLGMNGGWDALLKAPAAKHLNNALSERRLQLEADYLAVFGTAQGKRVLDDLLDQSWRRAPIPPSGTNTIEQLTPYVLERNGQNSTVFYIMKMVEAGRNAGAPKGGASRNRKKAA